MNGTHQDTPHDTSRYNGIRIAYSLYSPPPQSIGNPPSPGTGRVGGVNWWGDHRRCDGTVQGFVTSAESKLMCRKQEIISGWPQFRIPRGDICGIRDDFDGIDAND